MSLWVKLRDRVVDWVLEKLGIKKEDIDKVIDTTDKKEDTTGDEVDFNLLKWKYGGFNAGNGQIVAKIGSLNVSLKPKGGNLTYAWVEGGCEAMGASNASEAACICAVFGYVNGEWLGGKFDWISTSRTGRGLSHCWGYNGWDGTVMEKATKFAFVIVSKDSRLRSNVITCDK